jgi:signal transduction histidine kinase
MKGVLKKIFFVVIVILLYSCAKDKTVITPVRLNQNSSFVDSININFYKIYSENAANGLKQIKKAVSIANKLSNKKHKAIALKNYGIISYLSGNYKEAQKAYLNSYSLLQETPDPNVLAQLCNEMGNFYAKHNDSIRAFEKWKEAETNAKLSNRLDHLGTSYGMQASYYSRYKYYTLSDSLFIECYKIRMAEQDSVGIGFALLDLANIEKRNGDFIKSRSLMEESSKVRMAINDQFYLLETKKSIADLELHQNNYLNAIPQNKKVIEESIQQNYLDLARKCYDSLFVTYSKMSDYKLALKNKLYANNIKDSLFNVVKAKSILEYQTKYETTEKEKELLITKAQKVETDLELSKRTLWMYSFMGGLLILLFGGYMLIQRNKRKHQLEKHLAIIDEKESGMQAMIQAEEKERSRIAKELHDGIVQDIGSVILGWRNKNLDDKNQKLLNRLEIANQELRNVSHQLMPKALEELGLIAALEDMLQHSLGYTDIKYNFESFNLNDRLSNKIEITIYRIAQELVHNIIKHSNATEVSVQLFKNRANVLFVVEDNGKGIKDNRKEGIGLLNIKSRIATLRGSVNFESIENSGTLVTIKIPV